MAMPRKSTSKPKVTSGKAGAEKHPGGRPSTYDPAYCERIIALAKEGKSLAQISVVIDVPRTTMLSWGEQHPEFSTALTRAKECEQAWWEDQGMTGMTADKFNSAVWAKSMSARFRDEYTERREVDATHKHDFTGAKESLESKLAGLVTGEQEG